MQRAFERGKFRDLHLKLFDEIQFFHEGNNFVFEAMRVISSDVDRSTFCNIHRSMKGKKDVIMQLEHVFTE